MTIGIVGAGEVGSACLFATLMRGFADEVILVDRNPKKGAGLVTDMQYGVALSSPTTLRVGDYADLKNASLVMITVGINEKTGGATDRSDPSGRLKLLATNAGIYRDVITKIEQASPNALVLVVTDPPDPLAQLAGEIIGNKRVLSAGTFLDSLRFQWHLAHYFGVHPFSVEAHVLGEHGTSEVFLWSSARIGGSSLKQLGFKESLRQEMERQVRYANITIIEGISASQYGIGMACARIAEMVLRDERCVIPIGSYHERYKTVLSLPSVIGKEGIVRVIDPEKTQEEDAALQKSAEAIYSAYKTI